ncbi:hypothetical protein CYMTET_45008 [Cymbomonas tetramitiformis]|uniref:Uncharacterized protein n=1 Tax=Cymbomonas tetramitiformis TaxID=36881 RepID=A0AAE0C0S5_9CHLO|nr:hypothetical protein CYMTET_45008 [Cymbomonas tetramitiformis]
MLFLTSSERGGKSAGLQDSPSPNRALSREEKLAKLKARCPSFVKGLLGSFFGSSPSRGATSTPPIPEEDPGGAAARKAAEKIASSRFKERVYKLEEPAPEMATGLAGGQRLPGTVIPARFRQSAWSVARNPSTGKLGHKKVVSELVKDVLGPWMSSYSQDNNPMTASPDAEPADGIESALITKQVLPSKEARSRWRTATNALKMASLLKRATASSSSGAEQAESAEASTISPARRRPTAFLSKILALRSQSPSDGEDAPLASADDPSPSSDNSNLVAENSDWLSTQKEAKWAVRSSQYVMAADRKRPSVADVEAAIPLILRGTRHPSTVMLDQGTARTEPYALVDDPIDSREAMGGADFGAEEWLAPIGGYESGWDEQAWGEDEQAWGEDEQAWGEDEQAWGDLESDRADVGYGRPPDAEASADMLVRQEQFRLLNKMRHKSITCTRSPHWDGRSLHSARELMSPSLSSGKESRASSAQFHARGSRTARSDVPYYSWKRCSSARAATSHHGGDAWETELHRGSDVGIAVLHGDAIGILGDPCGYDAGFPDVSHADDYSISVKKCLI